MKLEVRKLRWSNPKEGLWSKAGRLLGRFGTRRKTGGTFESVRRAWRRGSSHESCISQADPQPFCTRRLGHLVGVGVLVVLLLAVVAPAGAQVPFTRPVVYEPVVAIIDTGYSGSADVAVHPTSRGDLVDGDLLSHGSVNTNALLHRCPDCTVLMIDITSDDTITLTDLIEGVRLATHLAVDVIVVPLSADRSHPDLEAAVTDAIAAGVTIFAAAGNYGDETPRYPAALDGVVAVASGTHIGTVKSESSRGDWVDLVTFAPSSSRASAIAAGIVAQLSADAAVPVATAVEAACHTARPLPEVGGGWLTPELALAALR